MPSLRTTASLLGTPLLAALILSGCSGSDDASDQPAASQQQLTPSFQVSSPNFQDNTYPRVRIPKKNSCYGANLSPPLDWSEVPDGTMSFALIAEDIDHQAGTWALWVLYNIPPDVTELAEGIPTSTQVLPDGTTQGTNDDRQPGYNGPCPPPNLFEVDIGDPGVASGTAAPHAYYFRLYALDAELDLAPGASKAELVSAMEGHILARADTVGKHTTKAVGRETQAMKESQTPRAGPSPTRTP